MTPPDRVRLDTAGRRLFALTVAGVVWAACLLQLALSLRIAAGRGQGIGGGLAFYFGFFTVLTNLLVAASLTALLAAPRSRPGRVAAHPQVATALAAGILFVGVAYHVLLRAMFDPAGLRRVAHLSLHYVTPPLYLAFWVWCVPKAGLRLGQVPRWTLYPLTYALYVLVRGEMTGLYPYPFVDVSRLGYGQVAIHTLGILATFSLLGAGLVGAARAWEGVRGRNGTPVGRGETGPP